MIVRVALVVGALGCSRAAPDIAPITREVTTAPSVTPSASAAPASEAKDDPVLPIGALRGTVRELDGRVLVERDGATVFATHGKFDSDPVISPDRRLLAFVRRRPEVQDAYYFADPSDRCDLWLAREGEPPRRIMEGGPKDAELFVEAISRPRFTSDSKLVLFEAPIATTAHGVYATDLAGRLRLVSDGRLIGELLDGPFKGHLFVEQRRLDWKYPPGSPKYRGRIERYAIVSKEGREVRYLGDDEGRAFHLAMGR